MALQFACIVHKPTQKKKKKIGHTVVLEAVTRREQSLALFHLLGKVLYNKRPFFFFLLSSQLIVVRFYRQRRSSKSICVSERFTKGTRS